MRTEDEAGIIWEKLREYLRFLLENEMDDFPCPLASDVKHTQVSSANPRCPSTSVVGKPLAEIEAELGDCRRCPLCRTRKKIVFGEGNPRAHVVFVGEGPGAEEDRSGRPFVGRAGELLTKIITNAMAMSRQEVYICNIIKCRPPGNRTPEKDEIRACLPFLEKQIETIGPKVIITLGQPAACALLHIDAPIHVLRGIWHDYRGIPLMPTFHPSYVLRKYTVDVRRQVLHDTREVMSLLGKTPR